jgi:lipoprotein signal peptidase
VIGLWLTVVTVIVGDQTVKFLVRRRMGPNELAFGRFGSLRMVEGQLWLRHLGATASGVTIWTFWVVAAVVLVTVGAWIPSSWVFVGLLLGGSLSNTLESSLRGTVSDFVCLRFWPPFNLADLALTAGAIGTLKELLIVGSALAS